MTRTGTVAIASAIGLFILAGTEVSAKGPDDPLQGPSEQQEQQEQQEGNQGPFAENARWTSGGPRRIVALKKKRKRHGKTPGAAPSEPSGANRPSEKADGASDGDESGDDTSGSAESDVKKKTEKPRGEGEAGDKDTPVTSEPGVKRKQRKTSEDADAGNETQVAAKAERRDDNGASRPEALDVAVGLRVMARSLTYTQDIYGNPTTRNSKYGLPAAPVTALTVDFYPAALFMDGFAANLGLTADVGYLLPVVTTPSGTGSYKAESLSWLLGAKVRLPLGLFATVAYGDQRYQQTPTGNVLAIELPKTDYKFVRGGAGIRYLATREVSLMANVAYLQCLSIGPIGSAPFYPKGKGAAFDAGVAVGYRIKSMFEIRAGVDVRRYGLALHVTAADYMASVAAGNPIRVAGGAVDQYLSASLALAVILDGQPSRGGGRFSSGNATRAGLPASDAPPRD